MQSLLFFCLNPAYSKNAQRTSFFSKFVKLWLTIYSMWQNDESDYTIKPRFQRETSDAFRLLNCANFTHWHPISPLRSAYTAYGALFHTFTVLPQYFLQTSKKSGLKPPWIALWPYVLAQQPRVGVHENPKPILSIGSCIIDQSCKRSSRFRNIIDHFSDKRILRGWVLNSFLIRLCTVQGLDLFYIIFLFILAI